MEVITDSAMVSSDLVQVTASAKEINRRINTFMKRKREELNLNNLRDFCYHGAPIVERQFSCARVDAVLIRNKHSKSHLKVCRVENTIGPQVEEQLMPQNINNESVIGIGNARNQLCPEGAQERLINAEGFLGLHNPPADVFARLKDIEDRILFLESVSPEYFSNLVESVEIARVENWLMLMPARQQTSAVTAVRRLRYAAALFHHRRCRISRTFLSIVMRCDDNIVLLGNDSENESSLFGLRSECEEEHAVLLLTLVLSPVIVVGNGLLLAAALRNYKRLRTPSNLLVSSLAASDLSVGLALPVGIYVRFTESPHCLIIYCILISLCSASLLVMASIAMDRFMSLSQPLRYNDLITHKSMLLCLACFWLYSFLMGFSPAISRGHLGLCSFHNLVDPNVQWVLLMGIYGPCCAVVVYCYAYTYVVARYHARAIYTIQVSVSRGQAHLAVSRYSQTLAITVGCFLILWLPFQSCMVVDLVHGSQLVSCWRDVILSLPIFVGSAVNPWVYGFRNSEIRAAVLKMLAHLLDRISPTIDQGRPDMTRANCDAAELNSMASQWRLYGNSPHGTASVLLTPRPARPARPEKTTLLVVPDIRLEVILTSAAVCQVNCSAVSAQPPVVLV